jgi:acyl-coenzyme A thioesterase PaaI-like protein
MKIKQPNSSQCFACGMDNPIGLKLHFYQTAPDEVTAEYTAPEKYQGYPGILHGGVTAAILDEAAGRAHMGTDPAASNFMVTAQLNVKYKKKIPIGQPLKIVGKQGKRMRWTAEGHAYIYDAKGTLLAEAYAMLVDLPDQLPTEDLDRLGWKVYPDAE